MIKSSSLFQSVSLPPSISLSLSPALFGRKKATARPFKEIYADWVETLETTLLPLLRHSLSSSSSENLLSSHVDLIHSHFQSYYKSLDLAASDDVSQLLYPEWRNPLEKPFLFLGDFHPNIFTTLIRSFLEDDDDNDDDDESEGHHHHTDNTRSAVIFEQLRFLDRPWNVVMAWKNPSQTLNNRVGEIERGLRSMVPALMARAREAQTGVIDKVAVGWARCDAGRKEEDKAQLGDSVTEALDELTCVVLDANRIRRSVLSEIIGETDVYQSALFLEGLAQFVVGCRDSDLIVKFKRCKMPLSC